MKRAFFLPVCVVAMLLMCLGVMARPAVAAVSYGATLYAEQEIANPSPASLAAGSAQVFIGEDRTTLAVSLGSEGLVDVGYVLLRIGPMGQEGSPAFILYSSSQGAFPTQLQKYLNASNFLSSSGTPTFADALTAIESGNAYINIHTQAYQGGEIRGQILPSPTAPTITETGPLQGGSGTTVTLTGTNFTSPLGVRLNGARVAATLGSATSITATIGATSTSGVFKVLTPGGIAHGSQTFNVLNAPPAISQFSPTSGPVGQLVYILGANLTNDTTTKPTIKFNGVTVPVADVDVQSPTVVKVKVPAGATTGRISATTTGGTATSTTDFTVPTDTTAPASCLITTPATTAGKNLVQIAGTAADNEGGSGITRVVVYLRRPVAGGGYQYWSLNTTSGQYEWGSLNRGFEAGVTPASGGVAWSRTSNLPSGANLPDGTYFLHAYAYDVANNAKLSATYPFVLDRVAPLSVAVTVPAAGAIVPNLALPIQGTAEDNSGGSGIGQVRVFLRRQVSGVYQYWGLNSTTNQFEWSSDQRYMIAYLGTPNTASTAWYVPSSWLPTGSSLADGTYYVHAYAYDRAENARQSNTNYVLIDGGAPISVVVSTPTNNGVVRNLAGGILGIAQDNSTGRGIGQVRVYLKRPVTGGYQYWGLNTTTNQYEWSSIERYIVATLTGGNTYTAYWSINGSLLPGGANLPDGTYGVHATAIDKAGNIKIGTGNLFIVDTTAPTAVGVATPAYGSAVKNLAGGILGYAQDNVGGSGIYAVKVYLRRPVTGGMQYWGLNTSTNQYEWSSDQRYFIAVLTNPNAGTTYWSVNGGLLPSGANLTDGYYYVHAFGVDRSGYSTISNTSVFRVDSVVPLSATVITPTYNSVLANLNNGFTGSAQDNAEGSGIGQVKVYLRRLVDNTYLYWGLNTNTNAYEWSGDQRFLIATLGSSNANGTAWSFVSDVLPSGGNLPTARYYVHAVAVDRAGNAKTGSAVGFYVSVPAGASASVSSGLSGASANAANGTIALVYSVALDADSASDAAHYSVQVNGAAAVVEGVAYNAASRTVTLSLGSLPAGASVSVQWQGVATTNGGAVAGGCGPIAAN